MKEERRMESHRLVFAATVGSSKSSSGMCQCDGIMVQSGPVNRQQPPLGSDLYRKRLKQTARLGNYLILPRDFPLAKNLP